MAESDGVGLVNMKDCGNELEKPSCCTLNLGTGFTLLVPSTRIARGECEPGKLTEDAFAVIMFFFMVKPISNGVCTCTEERASGGCLSVTILVA